MCLSIITERRSISLAAIICVRFPGLRRLSVTQCLPTTSKNASFLVLLLRLMIFLPLCVRKDRQKNSLIANDKLKDRSFCPEISREFFSFFLKRAKGEMSLSESVVLQEQGQLQHEQLHLQIKGKSFHHLGLKTHRIPMSLFRKNRQRLLSRYQLASSSGSLIVLKGGEGLTRHATDSEPLFRQESFFFWAFGVIEPDCFATIDITTGESTLYVPRLPESYAVWMGHIKSLEEFKEIYQVDKVLYENQFDQSLSELTPTKIILLEGTNSDSGLKHVPASHPSLSQFLDGNKDQCEIDKSSLFHHMSDLRAVKTEEELAVLRYTNLISSGAHVQVMRTVRPGMMEYQLEANFNRFCYFHGGCRQNAYTCICGSGINSSVLHYGHATAPNDRLIGENDMLLLDMGGEYFCFASDITCSYPSSGKFSKDQVNSGALLILFFLLLCSSPF